MEKCVREFAEFERASFSWSYLSITASLKNGPFQASFFFIFVFSIQLRANKCSINFADEWIRTADLWYWKWPLYQLSHNHCPVTASLCNVKFTKRHSKHLLMAEMHWAGRSQPLASTLLHWISFGPQSTGQNPGHSYSIMTFLPERFHTLSTHYHL